MGIGNSERLLKNHIPSLLSLWRGGGGNGPMTKGELERASNSLINLQRGLTGSRKLAGAGYMQDSVMLGAYLMYYWPVSYLQVSLALSSRMDVISSLGSEDGVRILDVGSGPGGASCALCDLLPHRKKEIVLVDASGKALKQAVSLLSGPDTVVTTHLCDIEKEPFPATEKPYDCILLSHTLNELWTGQKDAVEKRVRFLKDISASSLSPQGMLFLAEPALLGTSRELLSVRDGLVKEGFTILSPCIGDCPCGALAAGEGHTCHAEIGWKPIEPMASLADKANLDRQSVKMTFFLLKKGMGSKNEQPKGTILARVVSDAMLNKGGRVRYLLCDGKNRFAFSAKSGDSVANAQGFFKLRRYDLIQVTHAESRGDGSELSYGFGEGTRITVLSRIAQ